MRKAIEVGLLLSSSGDYEILARASRDGVLAGIAQVNADEARRIRLAVHERDPQGRTERYGALCSELLMVPGLRHVFGCTTSWSRKEVIPVLERFGSMLWYSAPYEGFEANEHVVYTHACPNQHIVPLLRYVMPRYGARAFLAGSNYVWGWEVNRVARDLVGEAGGQVLGERYLPIGDTDVSRLVEEIRKARPSFVLNNLIGPSSYAFLKAYRALGEGDAAFSPERCPVLSCNLNEPELAALDGAGEGHLVVSPYLAEGPEEPNSFHAAAHSAVLMLADALEAAGTDDPSVLRAGFGARSSRTPLGSLRIDPQTQHTSLPVRIGRVTGALFRPVWSSEAPLAPDPYLSRPYEEPERHLPHLRVVS